MSRREILRRIRGLRKDPRQRDAEGVFVAEGVHLVTEALAAGAPLDLAVVSARLDAQPAGRSLRARLAAAGVVVYEVNPDVLDSMQEARSPQPVLAVVRRRVNSLDEVLAPRGEAPLVIVAHRIQDPGNLGTILRTALAAGATGALVTGDGADLHHPRSVRATSGAIYRLRVAAASISDALDALARHGIALVAADPAAKARYEACDFRLPTALLLGGEGGGLPRDVLARAGSVVRIPMRPSVESLSVGAAAAVLLFEAARQREGISASTPARSG